MGLFCFMGRISGLFTGWFITVVMVKQIPLFARGFAPDSQNFVLAGFSAPTPHHQFTSKFFNSLTS
jgi:hypothetical protein